MDSSHSARAYGFNMNTRKIKSRRAFDETGEILSTWGCGCCSIKLIRCHLRNLTGKRLKSPELFLLGATRLFFTAAYKKPCFPARLFTSH